MRVLRYFVVGGVAAAVDIVLYALFASVLGYPYLLVSAMTFVLATAVNYVLSIRHVFESGIRFGRREEIALVFLASGIGLAINQLILWMLVAKIDVHLVTGKVLATGAVFAWNYLVRARVIFPPWKA